MVIKDVKGMYELTVDTTRNIVKEKMIGFLKDEDLERYHKEYENKIVPLFKGKKWTKLSDLTQFKASSISESGNKHLAWCFKNGMEPGAIVVENAIVKMQMNRLSKGNNVSPTAFTSVDEADAWLKAQGF